MSETNCLGLQEMVPCIYQEFNKYIKTHEHTYYFAHAAGERMRHREKHREVLKEPRKMRLSSCGFDLNVT